MNTRSISAAAALICAAMARNPVLVTIALALDAAGWLHTPESAAEVLELRQQNEELTAEVAKLRTCQTEPIQ